MSFKEKIDNLLSISGKKFNSLYELESKSGVGMGTLRKAYDENREPSKRIIWKFLEKLNINPEWWEFQRGDIYLTNGTHEEKLEYNKVNDAALGLAFKTIMEGGTEYILIARNLLQDKHRIITIEQMDKDERILNRLLDQNERLVSRVLELEAKAQLPEIQKTQ